MLNYKETMEVLEKSIVVKIRNIDNAIDTIKDIDENYRNKYIRNYRVILHLRDQRTAFVRILETIRECDDQCSLQMIREYLAYRAEDWRTSRNLPEKISESYALAYDSVVKALDTIMEVF